MDDSSFNELYHSDKAISYGGKNRILENTNLSASDVDKKLSNIDIYSRYKQYKKLRKYSPIYVRNKRDLFQSDLIAFTNPKYVDANDGYKYLLTTIDVFTKYAWVYPLKNKECDSTMKSFQNLLNICGEKPKKLQTDRGTEFICQKFQQLLKSENIHYYVSFSDRKCPVVERFNLTIQQIMYKILDKNSSLRWIDFLPQAMKIYNNRKHRTIKLSPSEAEKPENEEFVRKEFEKKYMKVGNKSPKAKFKVGDTVRIWKYKRNYERGYQEKLQTICSE